MKKETVSVLSTIVGVIAGSTVTGSIMGKTVGQKAEKVDKFKSYYNMLNQWLILKQEGKSLVEYFTNAQYQTIGIYGMGEMGNRLYDELRDSTITVKYAVDKEADNIYSELNVVDPDSELETVDVMIVTATFAFDEIKERLEKTVTSPIVSLEDIIYEI